MLLGSHIGCHSRESGNPLAGQIVDARLRGHDKLFIYLCSEAVNVAGPGEQSEGVLMLAGNGRYLPHLLTGIQRHPDCFRVAAASID